MDTKKEKSNNASKAKGLIAKGNSKKINKWKMEN